jgi:hypothetical protein
MSEKINLGIPEKNRKAIAKGLATVESVTIILVVSIKIG